MLLPATVVIYCTRLSTVTDMLYYYCIRFFWQHVIFFTPCYSLFGINHLIVFKRNRIVFFHIHSWSELLVLHVHRFTSRFSSAFHFMIHSSFFIQKKVGEGIWTLHPWLPVQTNKPTRPRRHSGFTYLKIKFEALLFKFYKAIFQQCTKVQLNEIISNMK